jgi:hypothetical protein
MKLLAADEDDRRLDREGLRHARQLLEQRRDHGRGECKRRGAAADEVRHVDEVDDAGAGAADTARQERQAARTQAQVGLTALVESVGDGDGRHAEDRPTDRPPMEDAVGRCPFDGGRGARCGAERRRVDVVGPFDHCPINERRTDAGAEDHADPADGAELRFRVASAEADLAVTAAGDETQEAEERDDVPLIEETEVAGQLAVQLGDDGSRAIG